MKKILLTLALLVVVMNFTGCNSDKKAKISIEKAEWSTEKESVGELMFGKVKLHISGSTNCERVTVMTYGDGIPSEVELTVKSGKFEGSEIIEFTSSAVTGAAVEAGTIVKGYNGDDEKEIEIESENLTY